MAKHNWIPEATAAQRLQRHPRTLRTLVKQGRLDISYTHINGRSFHYSERDIEKLMEKNAVIINQTA